MELSDIELNEPADAIGTEARLKTVAVLSRHNVSNYGSVLQAYATEKVLADLGFRPITVNYLRTDETVAGSARRYSRGKSLAHRLYRASFWSCAALLADRHFAAERKKLLHETSRGDESTIWDVLPEADVYLTGSDQVWNVMGDGKVDGTFFWSGLQKDAGRRIVSYAASFGTDTLASGAELQIAEWLNRYDAISVREDSGVRLVELCGISATHVLDPTLLLDSGEWQSLSCEAGGARRNPYALVYNLHPHSEMLRYAVDEVRDSGLELVSICPTFRKRVGRHVFLPTVGEFLALFKNATCVYTDSFHGTAFSVTFKRPFVAFMPKENSARNESLLRLLQLETRNRRSFTGKAWDQSIDWNAVHAILESERRRSILWLKRAVEGEL